MGGGCGESVGMSKRKPVRLMVIPEPEEGSRVVLKKDDASSTTVFLRGNDSDAPSLLCGGCGVVLVERTQRGTMGGIVLRCPRCGSYNDTP